MKKGKKKIISALTALLLIVFTCIPAAAAGEDSQAVTEAVSQESGEGFANEYYRLQDLADLLSEEEEQTILASLDEVSERQKLEIVIVTTNTLEGKDVVVYADDFYDECNFGYGPDKDGILLLISMEDRDCYISTCGYGITAFTDAGIERIRLKMTNDLSEGDYAAAFETFIQSCDEFIHQARTDKPYDVDNLPEHSMATFWHLLFSIPVGLIIAACTVMGMEKKMKNVRFQPSAKSYVREGSLNVTQEQDVFLYHTVTKVERPKDNDSGSGGGSSTHTSSSGQTHGGGGGKF